MPAHRRGQPARGPAGSALMTPRRAGTTAAAAPSQSRQGAAAPDSGGAGPGLGPERAIPRCARSFRMTAGSCSVTISRRRPSQYGHPRTSIAKEDTSSRHGARRAPCRESGPPGSSTRSRGSRRAGQRHPRFSAPSRRRLRNQREQPLNRGALPAAQCPQARRDLDRQRVALAIERAHDTLVPRLALPAHRFRSARSAARRTAARPPRSPSRAPAPDAAPPAFGSPGPAGA
jgi:hypothetical protein